MRTVLVRLSVHVHYDTVPANVVFGKHVADNLTFPTLKLIC